jgi:hypothetical protein
MLMEDKGGGVVLASVLLVAGIRTVNEPENKYGLSAG